MFPLKPKVYIDGKDGTTGLQIYDRLSVRDDIDLLLIDEDKRKDPKERKKLMDAADKEAALFAPCPYGMGQGHKHLPEMQKICGLTNKPVFTPIVDDYYKGMATTVPFHMSQMSGVSTLAEVRQKLADYYAGAALVHVAESTDTAKLYANAQAGKDTLELIVAGNDEQFTVTALFDNLGKGASGAAVQNMNLMLGFDETTGLNL